MRDFQEDDSLTHTIIGAAIQVHRRLGPGLLESVYHACLQYELARLGLKVQSELWLPIQYDELRIENAFRIDLLVEGEVVVELKALEEVKPIHKAQVLTYLKLAEKRRGLLINFNTVLLKDGVSRLWLGQTVDLENT